MAQPIADADPDPDLDLDADPEAVPAPYLSANADGWMVKLDFSDGPGPETGPIPEQRAGERAETARPAEPAQPAAPVEPAADAGPATKVRKRKKAAAKAAETPPAQGAVAGRRPSPLLLLSCGLLVGGAVTGFFPAMLAGWGLGYLSRRLTDFMRKFVILGIPLITMSATTFLAMQRAGNGRGDGLQPGAQLGQLTWSAAPGVLRVSAALSALVLLAIALRRRPRPEG
ncbi:hypothetical protein ACFVHB_22160 [Kitasatospora sp. NPDC127111]|uniref:hypothetical protein n=1 Tax=Kitasatospora sp. NPDC127111 TaxID=3345363 RepID=UPI003636430B